MPTKLDIIKDALAKIGVYSDAMPLSSPDAESASREFDRMMGMWSNSRLLIYQESVATFAIAAGQSTRTVGPTGQWVTSSRPMKIERINLVYTQGDDVEVPIQIYTYDQWSSIPVKTVQGPPVVMWPNMTVPDITLNFYMVPDQAYNVTLYMTQALTAPAALSTSLVVPPGYEDAIVNNLAVRCAPTFDRPVPQDIREDARKGLAELMRQNTTPLYIATDGGDKQGLIERMANRYVTGMFR